PVSIYGHRWDRAPEWSKLRRIWRGPGIYAEEDYAKAIQCAKICIGLLSKGNRDLHTQRSLEIPSLGSVLVADRTSEHELLYQEDKEAVFWSDVEECAVKCKILLSDHELRRNIARGGRARYLANKFTNEHIASQILSAIQ